MGMVLEPIRPVPPITTIFIANLQFVVRTLGIVMILRQAAVCECGPPRETRQRGSTETRGIPHLPSGRLVKLDPSPVDQYLFATRPDLDLCQRSRLSCL